MSTSKYEMESFFTDAPEPPVTDYDKSISSTRKKMKSSTSPCESEEYLIPLIAKLKGLQKEYYTKPCIEGYCFSLAIPHKSRIQRRVETLDGEREAFSQRCLRFERTQILKDLEAENVDLQKMGKTKKL